MAWQDLALNGPAYRNADDIALQDGSAFLQNGYINEFGHTLLRPGLTLVADLGTNKPVDGLAEWVQKGLIFAVSDGRVWKFSQADGGDLTELTGATLNTGTLVSSTNDSTYIYFANGGKIVYSDAATLTELADADAPTAITHVAFLDQYILANVKNTGQWQFSEVLDGTSWRAIDIFTAEAFPDNLLGIYRKFDEIILAGQNSIEFWVDDGISPFARVPGTTVNAGMAGPYGMVVVDGVPYWLNQQREIVFLDARKANVVSIPIQSILRDLSDVQDVRFFTIYVGSFKSVMATFPNAQKTFLYNVPTQSWVEWTTHDVPRNTSAHWLIGSTVYSQTHGLQLIGDRRNGRIYKMDYTASTDAGEPIRLVRRTGFLTRSTSIQKSSHRLRLHLKRGEGAVGANPACQIRWRNKRGAWSNPRTIALGEEGEFDIIREIPNLGSYRTRQYELTMTDAAPFHLIKAEEDVSLWSVTGQDG